MLTPFTITFHGQAYPESKQKKTVRKDQIAENSDILNQRQKKTVRTKSNSWKFHEKRRERFLIGSDVLDKGCPLCSAGAREPHGLCGYNNFKGHFNFFFSKYIIKKNQREAQGFLDKTSNDTQTFLWMILKLRHQENQIVAGILMFH